MGRGISADIFAVILVAVVATLCFAGVGLWLNRRHNAFRRPAAAFLWALLTVAPLAAAGLLLIGDLLFDHDVEPGPKETVIQAGGGG